MKQPNRRKRNESSRLVKNDPRDTRSAKTQPKRGCEKVENSAADTAEMGAGEVSAVSEAHGETSAAFNGAGDGESDEGPLTEILKARVPEVMAAALDEEVQKWRVKFRRATRADIVREALHEYIAAHPLLAA